jgi:hypothetical protein
MDETIGWLRASHARLVDHVRQISHIRGLLPREDRWRRD